MTTVIGIDPGQSGGIAVLQDDCGLAAAHKMPVTERDLYELLKNGTGPDAFAFIEQVHSMPGQGVASSFKFGQNYGTLRMALVAAGIPFDTVTPQKWQHNMHCMSKGDKNVTKRRAQELFPDITITHAKADALLIAAYGWSVRTGTPY